MSICSPLRALGRFGQDCRGATLPMMAVGVSVLVGAGAVAVDAAQLYAKRGELQATVDSAGRSAAWEIPNATATAQKAIDYAEQIMDTSKNGNVLVPSDVTLGRWSYIDRTFTPGNVGANAVHLIGRRGSQNSNPVNLIFARVFGPNTTDVSAEAIAAKIDITACVLALQGAGAGLEFNGGVKINSPQCGLAANSQDPNAALLTQGASGNVSVESLYLLGGMTDPGSVVHSMDPPMVGARRPFEDPYAEREFEDFPTSNSPTHTEVSKPSQPVTLKPGIYPSGFEFRGDVTMEPGIYVMQSDVVMTSQANVVGDGVTIVLQNHDITVDGGATTDITAPTTGSTAGIAVMRQGASGSTSTMAGGSSMSITGAIYMPDSLVEYAGSSDPGGCLQLIARRVLFRGDTNFNNNCGTAGTNDMTMTYTMLVK